MRHPQKTDKIAILVTDGFEQVELTGPRKALDTAGYTTEIVSPNSLTVMAMVHENHGRTFRVDVPLSRARPSAYRALLLPGGVMNPDALRLDPRAVRFVRAFFKARKPVAAICHGPIMLIEAGVLNGRTLTSFPSIKTDLRNAGARWKNKKVVADGNLVTSRKPADIPAFNKRVLELFGAKKSRRS